jgi:hypothetical protein
MATTYTGAWKRQSVSARVNPNLGATSDTLHLNPVDPASGFPEPVPNLPETPAYLYGHDDWILAPQVMHDPVDRTPLGHEYGTVQRDSNTDEQSRVEANIAREQDYGAADYQHFDQPIMRDVVDTYTTQRIEESFEVSRSTVQPFRGRNTYPENNPDGPPPQGRYVMRWIDRQMDRRRIAPDEMPLNPYRAAVAQNQPPATPGNPYSSPYDRLVNARRLKLSSPQLRRLPRQPEDGFISDGTESTEYSDPTYWSW